LYDVVSQNGAPIVMLGAGQMMDFASATDDNWPNWSEGTGGAFTFYLPAGTANMSWGIPWSYFNGLGGYVWSDFPPPSDPAFTALATGGGGCGSNGTCIFQFEIGSSENNAPANGQMQPDQCLSRGVWPLDHVTSANGRFTLQIQTDGNLVLVDYGENPPHPLWATNTSNSDANVAYMQSDGNFVLLDLYGGAWWTSNTAGNPGAYLTVNDSGVLEIFSSWGAQLWTSGNYGRF
jgi:hypothetical protein